MLYTITSPDHRDQEIRLFFSEKEAQAAATLEGRRVAEVAVHYDGLLHRLLPLGTALTGVDPSWTVPAEHQPNGSILVRGTIPEALFLP